MVQKTMEYYLGLPYKIEIIRDDDAENPGWVASVPDLPGCITQADTFEELGTMIEDALRAWLETALERGIPIPEPRPQEEYSGKFVVRVPRSLHRKLVEEAEAEGVSLNQHINVALAGTVNPRPEFLKSQPTPGQWPGLSAETSKLLISSGLLAEAEILDQKLFCGRVKDVLMKNQQAIKNKNYYAAQKHLESLREELSAYSDRNPIVGLLASMVTMWEDDLKRSEVYLRRRPSRIVVAGVENRTSEFANQVSAPENNIAVESLTLGNLFAMVSNSEGENK